MITLLSSTSGEKQACSPGAGHFAALPASTCQCPTAVKEPPGQPTHQPLSLSQPQGNRSCSGRPSVGMAIVLTGSHIVGSSFVKQGPSGVSTRKELTLRLEPVPSFSQEMYTTLDQESNLVGHWHVPLFFCLSDRISKF